MAIDSTSGSGAFGSWRADAFGLPSYRYTLDQTRAPFARQPEIQDRTDAWHQIGNERAIATASNDGHVQLWSQDRRYQWANRYEAEARASTAAASAGCASGGDGVQHALPRPAARRAAHVRDFGMGYVRRRVALAGLSVDERVYAPLGGGPVLVHEVTIRNTRLARPRAARGSSTGPPTPTTRRTSAADRPGPAAHRAADRPLTVAQRPAAADRRPLSIFAAALDGPVREFTTDAARSSARAARALPAAVAAGRLDARCAAPVAPGVAGRTMLAFQRALAAAPGRSGHAALRLRHRPAGADPRAGRCAPTRARSRFARIAAGVGALGAADPARARAARGSHASCSGRPTAALGHLLRGVPRAADPLAGRLLPVRPRLPGRVPRPAPAHPAADLRSHRGSPATCCCTRRPQQPRRGGQIPYAMCSLCRPNDALEDANDMDLWLLWTAAEYVLATRDTSVLDVRVRFADGGRAIALEPPQSGLRATRSRCSGRTAATSRPARATGRTSPPLFLQMTESTLVSAQLAYVYPARGPARGPAGRPGVRRDGCARRARATWPSPGASGRGAAGTRAGTPASARSAAARSSASHSRGRCWRARREAGRRARWSATCAAS